MSSFILSERLSSLLYEVTMWNTYTLSMCHFTSEFQYDADALLVKYLWGAII